MSNTVTQAERMEIVVNGSMQPIPRAMSLDELLEFLAIAEDRVAIELNGAIVRKQDWTRTLVEAGSKLEIVQFVGGG